MSIDIKKIFELTPKKSKRQCTRCSKIFSIHTASTNLKNHVKRHHIDILEIEKNPDMPKNLAGFEFPSNRSIVYEFSPDDMDTQPYSVCMHHELRK
ncbi:unnamed protein product [Gordionus sp. m RMFG-2023]